MAKTARPTKTPTPPKSVRPRAVRRKPTNGAADVPDSTTPTNGSHAMPTSDVALRAFELYCARGGQHGHDLDDWLQAESELGARS